MANVPSNLLRDWYDDETIHASEYKQEREILRTAINDNYGRIIKKFEIKNSDGSSKSTQNLDKVINYLQFQESDTIVINHDEETATLHFQVIDGAIGTNELTNQGVTSSKIADENVTTIKLADLAVTKEKIKKGEITLDEINLQSLDSRYYTRGQVDSFLGQKANKNEVYTRQELVPYLQGGDTHIRYDVFTVLSNNHEEGTFLYKDNKGNEYTGLLTEEGHQVFTLSSGTYTPGENRISATINDTLHRSTASGGLREISETEVELTSPEGADAEITFKYYERIGVTGEHNVLVGDTQPPDSTGPTLWLKVLNDA